MGQANQSRQATESRKQWLGLCRAPEPVLGVRQRVELEWVTLGDPGTCIHGPLGPRYRTVVQLMHQVCSVERVYCRSLLLLGVRVRARVHGRVAQTLFE